VARGVGRLFTPPLTEPVGISRDFEPKSCWNQLELSPRRSRSNGSTTPTDELRRGPRSASLGFLDPFRAKLAVKTVGQIGRPSEPHCLVPSAHKADHGPYGRSCPPDAFDQAAPRLADVRISNR